MRHTLTVSALVALAYALTGWGALQFAVPPGYSAPIFPAAGVALGAVLIYGFRLLPGVVLGSFAVQWLAALQSGGTLSWVTLTIPLFAGLQALAGAALARRLGLYPGPLDNPRPILLLMLAVAPLGCLVNASVAVPLLTQAGFIAADEALFNWWNWWVGDTLGVLIALPLMLVFFARPQEDWRPRRLAVALPMGVAIVLIGSALHQVRNWESLRIQTQLTRDTEHLTSLVRKRLDAQTDMTQAVASFMGIARQADRDDYREFVTPLLERYPGTQNFGWSPHVTQAQRARFEAGVRQIHRDDFTILDRDPGGRTFPAAGADEYLPITFVEPFEHNRSVYGLNPLSLPATALAIARTRHTGAPAVTTGFRLVQERADQRGVVVYQAVFERGKPASSDNLRGIISAVFRMDDAFHATLGESHSSNVDMCLVDLDGPADNQRLYGPPGCDAPSWMRPHVSRSVPMAFAGRDWQLRLRGNATYVSELRSWAAWTTIVFGLGTVAMLGAFLLVTSGHTRRISRLVERRTEELANTSRHLAQQQSALARAQRIARMGSWECEADGHALHCSDQLASLLGLRYDQPLALHDLYLAVVAESRDGLHRAVDAARRLPGEQAVDCRPQVNPDLTLHFLIEGEWDDSRLLSLRGTVQDVTSARAAEAHIQLLAHYDSLTGLPNRSLWLNRAQSALHAAHRHGDCVAVLFLDLDKFKNINDSLGHPVGDQLLASVARRLSDCLREEDVLARLGGDEFVALLPRLGHPEDAATVARKMLEALNAPMSIDGHDLTPSVSIGIALYPTDGNDVDTLLKHADTAMYGAKEAGRGNFQFFVPEMNVRAFERLMLENALRRAIERDELTLHYQPQVRTADGRVTGCEALVRWNHPELGTILPAQFIPVAEDSGLIVPLGEWVLRAACQQQVALARNGHPDMLMGVNISALQFRRSDFLAQVERALADTGANPYCLELEITESVLMRPSDELFERLHALGRMGITLALDDFGTGYSSLAYLKRLPIRRLKLDRSFVMDLPGDPEDTAVASATLSMARDIGLEVVAEGVENAPQLAWLTAHGCATLQGYYFARPMPADAFADWLEQHAASLTPSAG
jgi:diguanylate cyclase